MSQSNLNGFISNETDETHSSIFTETKNAEEFLKSRLPNNGDYLWFESEDEWLQIVNKGGRLWLEIGEGGA